MKAFFEEYGFVMLSAVVIVALISIAGTLESSVKTGVTDIMDGLKNKVVSSGNLVIPSATTNQGEETS